MQFANGLKHTKNTANEFFNNEKASVRFELTTSGFVDLRSNSVELQSRKITEGRGLEPLNALRTADFRTAASPVWRTFRKIKLIWDLKVRRSD